MVKYAGFSFSHRCQIFPQKYKESYENEKSEDILTYNMVMMNFIHS